MLQEIIQFLKFKREASIEEDLFDIRSVDNITSAMYLMRDQ